MTKYMLPLMAACIAVVMLFSASGCEQLRENVEDATSALSRPQDNGRRHR